MAVNVLSERGIVAKDGNWAVAWPSGGLPIVHHDRGLQLYCSGTFVWRMTDRHNKTTKQWLEKTRTTHVIQIQVFRLQKVTR